MKEYEKERVDLGTYQLLQSICGKISHNVHRLLQSHKPWTYNVEACLQAVKREV